MRKLLIVILLLVAGVAESGAQQRIDALLGSDMYNNKKGGTTYRMAVRHDPETGEVVKRVSELVVRDNKGLIKRFVEAFKAEQQGVDVWQEQDNGYAYDITAIWLNPKRIYKLRLSGTTLVVSTQIIYKDE